MRDGTACTPSRSPEVSASPDTVAQAQTDGREITRYAADITVADDGVADVRVELDFDFGDEPGHGPFLTLPTRQDIAGDDDQDRLYRITDVTASSDTAPDDLDVESTREGLIVRIGEGVLAWPASLPRRGLHASSRFPLPLPTRRRSTPALTTTDICSPKGNIILVI